MFSANPLFFLVLASYVDQVILSMELARERQECIMQMQRNVVREPFLVWELRGCDVKAIKAS